MWRTSNSTTLQQYLELYLKTDVLLLAEIFEEFHGVCKRNYGLDPALYVSSPQMSWDAMLRHTNCTLDFSSDPEMFSMRDAGIRGGVSINSSRHAQANHPYLAGFGAARLTSFII